MTTATKLPEGQTTTTRPWWASPTIVMSLGMVVVLVALAVWLAVTSSDPQVRTKVPRGCGPAAGSQTPLTLAPTTDWRLVGGMAAPTSAEHGPSRVLRGVPLCFSPDPTGALFAAATFAAANTDPTLRPAVIDLLVAPGTGQDAALFEVAKGDPGTMNGGIEIAGFHFLSYRPAQSATVDLAFAAVGGYFHVPFHLTWDGTDWKIVLPDNGHPFDELSVIPNLDQYRPWQGA